MEEHEYLVHPLRVARVERGFTQEELAQEIGLGVSTIRRAEQWFPLNLKSQRMISDQRPLFVRRGNGRFVDN